MHERLVRARTMIEGIGLTTSSQSERCPDCGAVVPHTPDGPVHAYFGASPGCWALYTAMLAHEFGNWDAATHRLSVDTYAVQHPGTSTRQAAANSVGIHLITLCLVFDRGQPVGRAIRTMGDLSKGRLFQLHRLTSPEAPYPMTIVDLLGSSPETYNARVRRWAETTWESWSEHHDQVWAWTNLTLQQTQR